MEDEATPYPHGQPWLPDDGDESAEGDDDQYIPDMDPEDWVDLDWMEHQDNGAEDNRGSGQGDQDGGGGSAHRGSGAGPGTDWTDDVDDHVCGHASDMHHLQQIQTIAKTDLRGPLGEQFSQLVANMAKHQEKKFREK